MATRLRWDQHFCYVIWGKTQQALKVICKILKSVLKWTGKGRQERSEKPSCCNLDKLEVGGRIIGDTRKEGVAIV